MPNIKSAIKRVSVTEHKTIRNKMVKSATKTALKKFNTNATAEMLSSASAAVDKDSEEEMSKMTGGLNIPGLG